MKQFLQLTVALVFVVFAAHAQERAVSGKVTSADDGSAVPGVNVVIKGTTIGTATDIDGAYKLSVPSDGAVLIFSFIGFTSQEITIGSRSVIDVSLELDVSQLSEVVITGYGERQKRTYTGSISTLGAEGIENRPVNSIDQVLQGAVPGLQLVASSGTPGAVQDIRIRGISSLTASNDPLFVIDGIPVNSGTTERGSTGSFSAMASISANDIESISVLKDATATAVYGARGTNGVIIITTKKGKSGKPIISFNAQYGSVDRATPAPKMLTAPQWDELFYEGLVNRGDYPDIASARAGASSGWDGVTDTKWSDQVLNKKAISETYDISVRGGGEKTNYYASVGYFNQDGVNKGINLERVTGKLTMSTFLTDKVNFSNSITAARSEQNGQLESSAYFGSPDAAYMFLRPTDAPYNPDGTINITNISGVIWNPLWFPEHNIRQIIQGRMLNNSALTVDLLKGLQFSSTLGLDFITTEELSYGNRYYGDAAGLGESYMYNSRTSNYVWKNVLSYNFELGSSSKLGFSVAYEAQKNNYKTIATGGYGIAADGLFYPSSAGTSDFSSGYVNNWAINSALALVNYSFRDKIFLDGSYRREGNSRFDPAHRWGGFYAIGASYILSEEGFLSGSSVLTFAKLRASYGKVGNAGIGLNNYQSFLSYSGDYNGIPAVSPSSVGNSELTWENSNQFSAAIDLGLFNRVNLSVEYYNRLVYDMLFDVPLSRTTGFNSQTQNLGEMVNRGFEVQADADILKSGDFTWNLGFNFTTVHNEVTKLPKDGNGEEIGIETSTYKITEGQPAYVYYMQTWAGVDPANGAPLWYTDETETTTTSSYPAAGKIFQDYARHATFFGSLNTRIEFKGIYLTASLYYSTGNGIYDVWSTYNQSDGAQTFTIANGYERQYTDRWQKPGDIASNPINIYRNTNRSNSLSTRRLYDGTFLRLRNITLGYNLPTSLVSKAKLSGARIYLMGNNFWTWKKDKLFEFDPEVGANGEINLNPSVLKTFSVGLNLTY